jgi:hypothetical protein
VAFAKVPNEWWTALWAAAVSLEAQAVAMVQQAYSQSVAFVQSLTWPIVLAGLRSAALRAGLWVWSSWLHMAVAGLLAALWCVWLYVRLSGDYIWRRMAIYYYAGRVLAAYGLTRKWIQWRAIPKPQASALYEALHVRYAPFVYGAMVRLRGFWLKTGQFMSSRADVVPDAWLAHLSKLQDAVPPAPWEEVRSTIEAELGGPVDSLFASFEHIPIAAASIAQVHRATLPNGRRVAVKVKHKHIAEILPQDLKHLRKIVGWVMGQCAAPLCLCACVLYPVGLHG